MTGNFSEENYGIEEIKQIFSRNLEIPNYQRPYKWSEKHTQQLLDDLLLNFRGRKSYRIGTVVFHEEDGKYYIVDGQQRLTTLSLVLYHLKGGNSVSNRFIEKEKSFHTESIYHLQMNSEVIKYFVEYNQGLNNKFKESFYQFIIEKCSMVYVVLSELEEAFQFFDSQNARGKALAPYDLLKAYHLRSLKVEKDEEIMRCVENWEKAVTPNDNKGSLDKIINHFLFRLRQWNLGKDGEIFENKDIDIFKGVDEEIYYPYLVSQKAGLALFNMSQNNRLMYKDEYLTLPFNIQQSIINGKTFFHFIEHYRNLEHKLFNKNSGLLLKYKLGGESKSKNVIDMITNYKGSYRKGDKYVRDLFKCAVFAYYDRFGENGLDIGIDRAFRWAYSIRLANQSVRFRTIENEAQSRNGLLSLIAQAKEPKDIMRYIPPRIDAAKCSMCGQVKEFFGVKDDANE